ncbi:hypothetical protein ACO0K3_15670 [Undibacterium sp. Rencai35W]|uniref:hypothetical protein n=1 Tax=Undibacterium sp. Rencai35W TaxID=3413046 RepID=UPI003BF28990
MNSPRFTQHGDIIANAAKAYLPAIGMKRKGRSRIWLKDNGWWLAVVEFQPSGWSKGTYLNVAATWLWYAKDYLSFDECKRAEGFAEFTDQQSFTLVADKYASQAAIEVLSLCEHFSSMNDAAKHLRAKADGNPWHHYHAMMASLANGELIDARVQQEALSQVEHNVPWCLELKAKAATIMIEARDVVSAQTLVSAEVAAARLLLKLPVIENIISLQTAQYKN